VDALTAIFLILFLPLFSYCSRIDKSEEFSFDHMLQFAKLGVAYVSETAGWV
jgi:hypothetical protein